MAFTPETERNAQRRLVTAKASPSEAEERREGEEEGEASLRTEHAEHRRQHHHNQQCHEEVLRLVPLELRREEEAFCGSKHRPCLRAEARPRACGFPRERLSSQCGQCMPCRRAHRGSRDNKEASSNPRGPFLARWTLRLRCCC